MTPPELKDEVRKAWTDEELRASVVAYRDMQRRLDAGERRFMKSVYLDLSRRFERTPSSFELRMQNISAVLAAMGRRWIEGLKPAKHVGAGVALRLEALINELDGNPAPPTASERLEVLELAAKPVKARKETPPPEGAAQPTRSTTTSLSFARSKDVKVWVLRRAAGRCECCAEPAPFQTVQGLPFLEVHHLRTLADGGSDRVSNAVALCPNCHRRLHFGQDAEACKAQMYASIPGLIRE
ncbi:HNH endonuclease [Hydrogenophaga sp. R2]|uniref:HNH endonuclease n=1 Tax=Hydrogenophaga sp. R2 TaxID=3132827 RepID=UPI003CED76BE